MDSNSKPDAESEGMVNPYANDAKTDPHVASTVAARNASMVKQVTLLGVLQMLMGAMEAMVALLLLFSAVIMPAAIAQAKKSPQGDFPTEMMGALVAYYYFIGTSVLLVGILRGISGIFCFFYVGRWFIILTLFLGLVSVGTFYCALFAIALAVYGMILLLHPAVIRAFDMKKQGLSVSSIKDYFESELKKERDSNHAASS